MPLTSHIAIDTAGLRGWMRHCRAEVFGDMENSESDPLDVDDDAWPELDRKSYAAAKSASVAGTPAEVLAEMLSEVDDS